MKFKKQDTNKKKAGLLLYKNDYYINIINELKQIESYKNKKTPVYVL